MSFDTITQYVQDAYKLQSWALAGLLVFMLVAGLRKFNWCPNRVIWLIALSVGAIFTTLLAPPAPLTDSAFKWRLTNLVIGAFLGGTIELCYAYVLSLLGAKFPALKGLLNSESEIETTPPEAAKAVPVEPPPPAGPPGG